MYVKSLSRVQLFATPWTVAYQALPSMGFSRQEYWSGLPFPSPGDIPDPGIKSGSPTLRVDALTSEPPEKPTTYEFPVTQPVLDRDKIFMTSILCVSMPLIEAEGMVAVEIVSWTEIQPPFGAFILWDHGVKII